LIEISYQEMARERTSEQRAAVEEALHACERVEHVVLVNRARLALCQLLVAEGDVEPAEELATAILESSPEDNILARRFAMHFLADCALLAGDSDFALERYIAAVDANWSIGARVQAINALQGSPCRRRDAAMRGRPCNSLLPPTACTSPRRRRHGP
jgi:hypothetical protein